MKKEWKHRCLRSVLTYQPDPLRPDRVTVGFLLFESDGESRRKELRFAPDLTSLSCIAPDLEIETVEAMLLEMEPIFRGVVGNVVDVRNFPGNLPDDFPDEIEILSPVAVLTDDFDAEVETQAEQLFLSRAADLPAEQRVKRQFGRIYLQKQLRTIFKEFDVWDHLDKRIAVDKYALKDDSLKIECGYKDPRTNTYRLLDSVSLISGLDRARILALSWPRIHDGLKDERGMQFELHAIVEDQLNRNVGKASDAWKWMQDAGMIINPVSTLPALASEARLALRL